MKKVVGLLFIIVLLVSLFSPSVSIALDQGTTQSAKILEVTRTADLRDRLWEKINLFFKFSQKDKIDYQQQLTEKRLAELKYVIDSDKGDMIEETSSRYSSYLGNLSESVVKDKMTNKKQELLTMLESHAKVLDSLINQMEVESGFWLLLKHDINYVKIYSDQIKSL